MHPESFRPAWWLPGGHLQTLSAAYWRGPQAVESGTPRRVVLPDGDALIAVDDCPVSWRPGDPAILMMHGLGGCARNAFLVRTAAKLVAAGVRVFRLNLRGCGAGAGLCRWPYHAGRSDDLRVAVEAVVRWCREPSRADDFSLSPPSVQESENASLWGEGRGEGKMSPPHPSPLPRNPQQFNDSSFRGGEGERTVGAQDCSLTESPIRLFGMSLSGNILLKYLGEAGASVPRSVRAALVANPPIDLSRSVKTLTRPLSRGYDRHFTKLLIEHVRRQSELRPDFAPLPSVLPKSLYDFDDRYTAPHGGYADAEAYYAAASAQSRLSSITLPTTIVTTADDPLVPVEMFQEQAAAWPSEVQLIITPGGGHLGYVSRGSADPDNRWLDWRVVEFVKGRHERR